MIDRARRETIEAQRRRIWGLCYRMTGERNAADDLAQESITRAIERADQSAVASFEGWLFRVATTTCLDWLRRRKLEGRIVSVVDPIDLEQAAFGDLCPESALMRREDLRLAIVTSLQALPARQRAVLVLRDVLDRSTEETAEALGIEPGNVKVLLHRARLKLDEAHRVGPCDAPVDADVVERFARALETSDLDGLTALFADEVWGLVDDGLGKRKPTPGFRAVARQWANALVRYGHAERVHRAALNGEPALLVVVAGQLIAAIHLETREHKITSTRVILDPARLARLGYR
jgi:RNA polymerase sigma-70 factor, ECF subfamily